MTLPAQQKRFVEEYLLDLNCGQAAIRAGYSEKTAYSQGARLLRNVHVEEAVNKALKARGDRLAIKTDRVLLELARIAFADLRQISRWDADRLEYVPSDELDDDAAAAVAEIVDKTTEIAGRNGERTFRREQRIKMHDKTKALDMLGRHLGMFKAEQGDGPNPVAQFLGLLSSGAINMDQVVEHLAGRKP